MVPTIFACSNRKGDYTRRRIRRIPLKEWIISIIKLNWGWELKTWRKRFWGVLKLIPHNIIENYYRRKLYYSKRIADANILRILHVCQYHSWNLIISILLQYLYPCLVKLELVSRYWFAFKRLESKNLRASTFSSTLININRINLILWWRGVTWSSFFARTLSQNSFRRFRRASYWISGTCNLNNRITAFYDWRRAFDRLKWGLSTAN